MTTDIIAVRILILMLVHFVADFCLQTSEQAAGKSSSNQALAAHVFFYSVVMAIFYGWQFGVITAAIHSITDWNTSRISSRLWTAVEQDRLRVVPDPVKKAEDIHMFFVMIGFDQYLHLVQLVLTYLYLFNYGGSM